MLNLKAPVIEAGSGGSRVSPADTGKEPLVARAHSGSAALANNEHQEC